MKKDKLSDLSMQLSVDVLNLVKELRRRKETIISNQIGRSATVFVPTLPKVNMVTVVLILSQNLKSH